MLNANKRLIETSKQFQNLYNKTPAMLHSIDESGTIIAVSDYWLDTLGYTRNEVLGKKSSDFLTEHSRTISKLVIPQFFAIKFLKNQEYDFVKKDGNIIHTILSAVVDNADDTNKSLAVITDITELKNANIRVESLLRRFELLYNNTPAMMHLINERGELMFVSDYWLEKMEYVREEVIGRKSIDFIVEHQKEEEEIMLNFLSNLVKDTLKNMILSQNQV